MELSARRSPESKKFLILFLELFCSPLDLAETLGGNVELEAGTQHCPFLFPNGEEVKLP